MSIIKHVTLQKIVAHDFRYDPRKYTYKLVLQCLRANCNGVCLILTDKDVSPAPYISSKSQKQRFQTGVHEHSF